MARKLIVEIVGDSSSLEKSFKRSSASANRFGRDMSKFGRGGFAATGAFRSLGRSVAFASTSFLGGVGLGAAIKASFDEMAAFQKAAAQTQAVLKSTGGVAGVTAEHVDALATSLLNVSGVDDELIKNSENLLLTFTNVRNVMGKNNDIFDRATKAALNLSVRFGKDLGTASIQLGRALQDPERGLTALSRSGVSFSTAQRKLIKSLVESGHVLEAQKLILSEVEKEAGGAARAYGQTLPGQFNKFRETLRNLAGAIAAQFNPALDKAVKQANRWISNTRNQKRVMDDVKQVVGAASDVFNVLRGVFQDLNKVTGSTKHTLELLFLALVAYKSLGVVSTLTGIASNIGLIGTRATTATGEVVALKGALGGLAAGGPIVVAVLLSIGIFQTPQYKQFHKDAERLFGRGGFNPLHNVLDQFRSFQGTTDKLLRQLGLVRKAVHDVVAPAGALGPPVLPPAGALGPVGRVGAERPGTVPPPPRETKAQRDARLARIRQAREAARQAVVDRAEFAVDRAAATKALTDDLAALGKLNALLKRRIAGGHDTLELEKQQFAVDRQIADVLKQQREAKIKARDARQFKLLGFGPTGEDIVPGVKNLRKQLGSVADAISGTFLDTRKTRGLLGHIRQVLAGGINSVSADVRSKVQQILADLKGKLKQSSVDVTKFQQSARGQFTLAGATPGGREAVVINGPVHFHGVQNVKEMENALLKRKKQRAHARRSTR